MRHYVALTMTQPSNCIISITVKITEEKNMRNEESIVRWFGLIWWGAEELSFVKKHATWKVFHPGLFTAERLFVCEDIVVQACPILALTSISLCCVRYKYKRTSKVAYHRGSSFHSALQTSVFREGWIVRLFIQADNLSLIGRRIKRCQTCTVACMCWIKTKCMKLLKENPIRIAQTHIGWSQLSKLNRLFDSLLGRSNHQDYGSSKCAPGPLWFSDRRGCQSE